MFTKLWREDVDEKVGTDPVYASGLYGLLRGLNDPAVPPSALDDVVSQPWRQSRRDWYDAAALIEVGLSMQAGWRVMATVTLDAEPGPDKDEGANNAKLRELRAPFSADFSGGGGDNDGQLSWDAPIDIAHDMGEGHHLVVQYPPTAIPLEVGRTEPETSIWHLTSEGGVARWPYKSTRLTLLLCTCSLTGRPIPVRAEVTSGERRLRPPPEQPGPDLGG
jgi:hypothetical protein